VQPERDGAARSATPGPGMATDDNDITSQFDQMTIITNSKLLLSYATLHIKFPVNNAIHLDHLRPQIKIMVDKSYRSKFRFKCGNAVECLCDSKTFTV